MTTITFPTDTKDTIDAIRGVIGRDITVWDVGTPSGCSVCSLDPVNNTSTDPFCVTCSGRYWIITYGYTTIEAHIRWYPTEEKRFTSAGIVHDGDCVATIAYSTANLSTIENAAYIEVDGKRMLLDKYVFRGKPTINRIRLLLNEED